MCKPINIYHAWNISIFDDGFEVRGVFLDISKAFERVWYNDLIYKLKQNGVAGDLLDTLTNSLKEKTKSSS